MSGTTITVDDYDYVLTSGVIVPDTNSVQATVEGEWKDQFGADLNVSPSTPQGGLITTDVLARVGVIQNNANIANQINPNLSEGVFLEAVAALSGLVRPPGTFTTVTNVTMAGSPSALVPQGSVAKTSVGDLFNLSGDVTLDTSGNGLGTFIAQQPGAIVCGFGGSGINFIVSDVLGWETVSTDTGVATINVGTTEFSDEQFRTLRRNTLALQGVSIIEAIVSAVNVLPGVNATTFLENTTASTATITRPGDGSGVSLLANSIWVCVDGGAAAQIASVLLQNKSGGCNWNGSQSVVVVDPTSGQNYTVKYEIPTLIPVAIRVTVKQARYVGDPATNVTQAIIDYSNNLFPEFNGFVVGQSASPFEISGVITMQCPGIYVKKVEMSLDAGATYVTVELPMLVYQKATITVSNIDVVVTV